MAEQIIDQDRLNKKKNYWEEVWGSQIKMYHIDFGKRTYINDRNRENMMKTRHESLTW